MGVLESQNDPACFILLAEAENYSNVSVTLGNFLGLPNTFFQI